MNSAASAQERFRWALWPVSMGWLLALWIGSHGVEDLSILLKGDLPYRGFVFGFVERWPRGPQLALAAGQIVAALMAVPSLLGFASRRIIFAIGESGITIDRWRGWRRIAWDDVVRLEFSLGDAVFHLRENGRLVTMRFRPWTIGLDQAAFRDLIERHQPRLTPDEDEGQPWARSSSFKA